MKKIIVSIFSLTLVLNSWAQIDRSTAPEPAPAPEVQIGNYKSFTLDNGLQVFVVENNKLPRVSFSLRFDIPPFYEDEKTGYSSITGNLIGTATNTKTKAEIDEAIDFIGGSLSASSGGMYATSLSKFTGELFDIFSEILLESSFKQEELDKIKQQRINSLIATKNDPGGISDRVQSKVLYGDHPYGEIITEESINAVTLNDCEAYYKKYYRPQIGYLAIVGDITLKEAKKLVSEKLTKWEANKLEVSSYALPKNESQQVAMVNRDESVQSIVKVIYPVEFKIGQDDYVAARVMNTILGGGTFRLFNNLRETNGYTYGSYSRLSPSKEVGYFEAFANVRNSVTDSATTEILYEMQRLIDEPVPEEELQMVKNYLTGNFALSLENPQTVARFALNTAIYNLPAEYYKNYLKKIEALTPADIQAAAKKYLQPSKAVIFVVGNDAEVGKKLAAFADQDIVYYDTDGNTYDPASLKKEAPKDLTADAVIEKYIAAIGGRKKWSEITSLVIDMNAEVQGNQLSVKKYQKTPNKVMMEMSMAGQVMSKQLFDGEKAKMVMMGQTTELEGDMLAAMKYDGYILPELNYKTNGYTMKLKGIEQVEGKETYVVEVYEGETLRTTNYFLTDSNLLFVSKTSMTSPMGKVEQKAVLSDYSEEGGILYPHSIQQSAGPQVLNIKVNSLEVNAEIEDSVFQ